MDTSEGPKKDEGASGSPTKLPYEPPRIVYQQRIEALAAFCDPGGDPQGKPDTITCQFSAS